MDLSTDLIQNAPVLLPTIFDDPNNLGQVLADIEQRARSETFDISTETGRTACASLAYKVARSKTAIAEVGDKKAKLLRADWDIINVQRRIAFERLDALRDEVRAPLNEWQKAEKERVAAHEDRLVSIRAMFEHTAALGFHAIAQLIEAVAGVVIDEKWEEFEDEARAARNEATWHLEAMLAEAVKAEEAEAELEQLRREKAERDERDRIEAEQRELEAREATAANHARKEAETKAAAELEAEKERGDREAKDAERRIADAEHKAEMAATTERNRSAAEAEEERRITAEREADEVHRKRILKIVTMAIIKASAADLSRADASSIAHAIACGRIPHTTINF